VIRPSPRFIAKYKTEGEGLAVLQSKRVPNGATEVQIVDEADIPADRTFRNAWQVSSGAMTIPLSAAKEVQKARIRQAREEAFKRLDGQYLKADETSNGAEKARIAGIKQALRDLPAQVDNASDLAEIRAVWHTELT